MYDNTVAADAISSNVIDIIKAIQRTMWPSVVLYQITY